MDGFCTVVTGAAGGIGSALVRRLAAGGGKIVAADIDGARLEQLFGADGRVARSAGDVTTDEGFETLLRTIADNSCGVCGFAHLAGFDAPAPLALAKPETFSALAAVHAGFPLRFLGWMSKKANRVRGASAVLVSSAAAHGGAKGHAAYSAAKAAVEGLTRAAAAELAPYGMRVNAVAPGVVDTELSRAWTGKLDKEQSDALAKAHPLGIGTPDQVAAAAAFLLSPDASWITGQTLVCDGGFSL